MDLRLGTPPGRWLPAASNTAGGGIQPWPTTVEQESHDVGDVHADNAEDSATWRATPRVVLSVTAEDALDADAGGVRVAWLDASLVEALNPRRSAQGCRARV
jgi:hypothetical protein